MTPGLLPATSGEEWRGIPGFSNYDISSLGRVRSRAVYQGSAGPRILRTPPTSEGYPAVHIVADDGSHPVKRVHALVLLAFVGERPEGSITRHLDGDPTNNQLTNLTYGSVSQNSLDQVRHGTHPLARRTHCKHGHQYTPENTATWMSSAGRPFRKCRTCLHRGRQVAS